MDAQGTPRNHPLSSDDPFCRTRWSIVLAARKPDSVEARVALEELCSAYWFPIYSYVRRHGHSPEDAQDLTQSFFARLLEKNWLDAVAPEKGRFRAFLLAALKHFLANEWDRSQAQKRGGGAIHVPLDAETRYDRVAHSALPPDRLFDRQWALAVLDTVLNRLREEQGTPEKKTLFDALSGTLTGDSPDIGYAEIGRRHGMNEGAVKVTVHRLRKRYRELLRSEIAQTVSEPSLVPDELQALFAAFRD